MADLDDAGVTLYAAERGARPVTDRATPADILAAVSVRTRAAGTSRTDRSAPPTWPNRDTLRVQCTSDGLLAGPEPQPHLHQRHPTDIQLDRFSEVALIETAGADRDRPADQMRRRRAAVHTEPLAQLNQGHSIPI